jgi:hypothetical protein
MRGVWSYWSLPYRSRRGFSWREERTHALSWILSVELARAHFESTTLHTDDEGARLLIDELGLPFDHVNLSLNRLRNEDADWWMQGKLQTYADQQEPFVHLDSDVYLFKPLPDRITSAPVLAQNPEPVGPGMIWYDVEACEVAIRSRGDGFIPPEWTWYRTFFPGERQQAACCGIFGGHHLSFIHDYAQTVLSLLQNPANRRAFDHDPNKRGYNPFFEQYLLAACARYRKVEITYLFQSFDDCIRSAGAAGFTHLMADTKRDSAIAARIEQRVASDYPEAYERCRGLAELRYG